MVELRRVVVEAQKGDEAAFGELVGRFQDMAVGYAFRVLNDFQLAEDAAQDAFLETFRVLPQLKAPSAFPAWFRQVVYKQCDRYFRRKAFPQTDLEHAENVASDVPTAHETVESKERRTVIRGAVMGLPELEREAVLLFYFGDCSQREVASFLGIPITTLKKRLYAGRQRLKEGMLDMVEHELGAQRPSTSTVFAERVKRMIAAVREGDVETVKALLDTDHRLLASPGGEWNRPPLHHAAERGHRAVIELLLQRGVDVASADEMDSATALHWAAESGHLDIVKMLVDLGADVNNRDDDHNAGPLGWAVLSDVQTEVAEFLISKGAEIDIFSAIALGRVDEVTALVHEDSELLRKQTSRNEFHRTPLHFAVEKRQLGAAKALLEAGADPTLRDDNGAPPLALLWVRMYDRGEPAGDEDIERFVDLFERFGFKADPAFNSKFRRGENMETTSPPTVTRISPQFLVADLEQSIEFYTKKLGFEVSFRYGGFYAGIVRDGHSIHLKAAGGDQNLDVACGVEGIDGLYEDVKSHSVEVTQPLRDMPYGREFYIADPDGHVIGFNEDS